MSPFIGALAFDDPAQQVTVRIGVSLDSLLSGIVVYSILSQLVESVNGSGYDSSLRTSIVRCGTRYVLTGISTEPVLKLSCRKET